MAEDLSGISLDIILKKYILKEIPVLVIVSPSLKEPVPSITWELEDGGSWTWFSGHHAMVIYGFDLKTEEVYVADSATYCGIATYPLSRFKEVYETKGLSAMTILHNDKKEQ